jgi:hypothetical protein
MAWVVDLGLEKLLEQIDHAAPDRSKASDGSIGDEAHQGTDSDHNPQTPAPSGNPNNQVDARDITHDPNHNADMGTVSEAIRLSKDKRVSYVIFNRRIYSGKNGPSPWVWRTYDGDNPHDKHMHVSVLDSTHDQTQDWEIGIMSAEDTSKAVWLTDGVVRNIPEREDYPENEYIKAESMLREGTSQAYQAAATAHQALAAVNDVMAKVDEIMAMLTGGITVPAIVSVSAESVAEIARATNDESHARSAE